MKGTITHFNDKRGFGFIEQEDGKGDMFVHIHNVEGEKYLKVGDEVEFDIAPGVKGPEAINVKVLVGGVK